MTQGMVPDQGRVGSRIFLPAARPPRPPAQRKGGVTGGKPGAGRDALRRLARDGGVPSAGGCKKDTETLQDPLPWTGGLGAERRRDMRACVHVPHAAHLPDTRG